MPFGKFLMSWKKTRKIFEFTKKSEKMKKTLDMKVKIVYNLIR